MNKDVKDIKAIGITNQRETCLIWDRKTGEPLCNAIVWHDTRTMNIVNTMIESKGSKDIFRKKNGLPLNTYFSASKFKWMMENEPKVISKLKNNQVDDLCFGTIDSWVVYVKII